MPPPASVSSSPKHPSCNPLTTPLQPPCKKAPSSHRGLHFLKLLIIFSNSPRKYIKSRRISLLYALYWRRGAWEWVLNMGEVGAEDRRHWGWKMGEVA